MKASKALGLSVFFAFGIGKITDTKQHLTGFLDHIYSSLHLYSIKTIQMFDFGYGYETTAHLLNSILTYTLPIFFILTFTTITVFLLKSLKNKIKRIFTFKKKVEEPKVVRKLEDYKPKRKSKFSFPKVSFHKIKLPKISFKRKPKKVYPVHPIGAYWLLRLVIGKEAYKTIPFD